MEKVNKNVKIISGLDKTELEEMIFELDTILGGIELANTKVQNINIEFGQISTKVENADYTDLTNLGMTMVGISHMVCLLSDFMHYVAKDLKKDTNAFSKLHSELSEAIKKA